MQIKVVLKTKVVLLWTFDNLRSCTRGVENRYLQMNRFFVECVMGEDLSLMDFFS